MGMWEMVLQMHPWFLYHREEFHLNVFFLLTVKGLETLRELGESFDEHLSQTY